MKPARESKNARCRGRFRVLCAEAEGFEPPVPCGTPVFKTGAIDQLCQTSVRVQIYDIPCKMFRCSAENIIVLTDRELNPLQLNDNKHYVK